VAPGALVPGGEPSLLATLLLGILQGLTEFLPVSSSGHLVLAQALLGEQAAQPGIALEVILHTGTLFAVVLAYRRDLWTMVADTWAHARPQRATRAQASAGPRPGTSGLEPVGLRAVGLLAAATLPVVVVAVLGAHAIEAAFENPHLTAGMLLVTGGLLLLTRLARVRPGRLGLRVATAMGLIQIVSLMPGISRSGSTIAGGLFAGGKPAEVVRFSFLMSVPAIVGAAVFELPEVIRGLSGGAWAAYALGFAAAAASGWIAIQVLLRVVGRGRLHYFGFYCIAAGILGLLLI
jgi:undecaprenyl-diphosphatase